MTRSNSVPAPTRCWQRPAKTSSERPTSIPGRCDLPLAEYGLAFCDGRKRPANLPSLPQLWPKDS